MMRERRNIAIISVGTEVSTWRDASESTVEQSDTLLSPRHLLAKGIAYVIVVKCWTIKVPKL